MPIPAGVNMSRSTYLGTDDHYVFVAPNGAHRNPTKTVTIRFWDSEVGGTQHTDLLIDGQPATEVVIPAAKAGNPPFVEGPEGVNDGMWMDAFEEGAAPGPRVFTTSSRPLTEAKAHTDARVNALTAADVNALPATATAADVGADPAGTAQTLVDQLTTGAPGALDTLNELAAALGDDANYAATVTNSLAAKLDKSEATATFELALPVATVTRNPAGRVTSTTEDGITTTYTRGASGRVASITRGGVTRTVTRHPSGLFGGLS